MTDLIMTSDALIALLSKQSQWQDRYRILLDLSTQLPLLKQREQRYVVSGCENQVWLKVEKQPDDTFLFQGDSDGRVVKGLLSVVVILAQRKTKKEIMALDFKNLFTRMKLTNELSESRWTGINKIIDHLLNVVSAT